MFKRGNERTSRKNVDLIDYDERGAAPCKHCRKKSKLIIYPKVVEVEGLYYAQCPNPKCHGSDKYEYLGTNVKRTIENWNRAMEGRQDEFL